eukprot:TRINITY_DN13329_c0_g1_i1.p1 TRINITY_DN13329_c0_g1~~TRINITY_DN13329_c0_g1_i1.p1  ORF type:complete len:530 (+),score=120.62 TRINITY_DN13329_c0_g1_i1:64-1653(+)
MADGFLGMSATSTRKVRLVVENHTQRLYTFAGEQFSAGAWSTAESEKRRKDIKPKERVTLRFENSSWFGGCAGYVQYASGSSTVLLGFSNPVVGAAHFAAHCGSLISTKEFAEQMPEMREKMRKAEGCCWEPVEAESAELAMRVILLPEDLSQLPGSLRERVSEAREVRRTEARRVSTESGAGFVERTFTLEITNESEECFVFDGEMIEGCSWSIVQERIGKGPSETTLQLRSESSFAGISGVFWFVNESSLDTYLSVVFINPLVGEAKVGVWAGPPPMDLRAESFGALLEDEAGHGCACRILDRSSDLRVQVNIPASVEPMDPLAYPPRVVAAVSSPADGAPETGPTGDGAVAGDDAAAVSGATNAAVSLSSSGYPTGDESSALAIPHADPQRAEDELAAQAVSDLLDATRPRDALDGTFSGLKVAGAGAVAGVGLLVSAPAVGAYQEGVWGFGTGLVQGVVGGAGLVVGGVVAGVTQVSRGIINTPEAVSQLSSGKTWDANQGKWVDDCVNLRAEILAMQAEAQVKY